LVNPLGVMVALTAGCLFAAYTFFNKRVLEKVDVIESLAIVFTISALMLLPFYFNFSSEGLLSKSGLLAIIYIGLITAAFAYMLFASGLKYIPSSDATTLTLAEPFTAAILGVFVLGEYLNVSAWIGVFSLLTGIIVLTMGPRKKRV